MCEQEYVIDSQGGSNTKDSLGIECLFDNEQIENFSSSRSFEESQKTDTPVQKDEKGANNTIFSDGLLKDINGLNKIGTTSPQVFVGKLIKIIMQVLGTIAFIMFVFGGVMWMNAHGNSERSSKALKTLVWASLGLVVIFASYALTSFVLSVLLP